jgi:hypothetical protein
MPRAAVIEYVNEPDLATPQREAAMFYGLFLRGHSVDALRKDIDVPRPLLEKWLKRRQYEPEFRTALKRVYSYRKLVLAIFDELVLNERGRVRVQ